MLTFTLSHTFFSNALSIPYKHSNPLHK